MRGTFFVFLAFITVMTTAAPSFADGYDAVKDFTCGQSSAWAFEGYRGEDGKYLALLFGHPMIKELSKYGADAFYLPDGGQENYPFFAKFDNTLLCSPATRGKRHDAVVSWTAPRDAKGASISGALTLFGNIRKEAEGRKIKAMLLHNGAALWEGVVEGGGTASFSVKADVKGGDRVRLHVMNDGDGSGNVTAVEMKAEFQ